MRCLNCLTTGEENSMEKSVCVVFADAFAYSSYIQLGGLGGGFSVQKIKPGIAYSSNLHYLLFDGKTPDDVGFFTDYCWRKAEYNNPGKMKNSLDQIDTLNNLYRAFERKFTKRHDNIPFGERAFFECKGKYKFMEPGECTVFGRKVVKAYKKTAEESFDEAEEQVTRGEKGIVVVLEILDHVGHEVGSEGTKYVDAAKMVIERTKNLFNHFKEKNPEGVCILISDHGMGDVLTGVDVLNPMKRLFGLPGEKYQVYNDSLYLRIWADSNEMLFKIGNYLNKIGCLNQIDESNRKKYGVTKHEFGDLIYVLKNGYYFNPNCFGVSLRGGVAGLHGYMEPLDQVSGILVTEFGSEEMIDAMNVFNTVRDAIGKK